MCLRIERRHSGWRSATSPGRFVRIDRGDSSSEETEPLVGQRLTPGRYVAPLQLLQGRGHVALGNLFALIKGHRANCVITGSCHVSKAGAFSAFGEMLGGLLAEADS